MKESKLVEVAFELTKLWNYLTRQELCNYFNISGRTLYTYSKKLNLPKKIDTEQITETTYNNKDNIILYVSQPNKNYKKQIFKNWEHFTIWAKSQSHPFRLDTIEKNGKKYMVAKMDRTREIKEALNLKKELQLI